MIHTARLARPLVFLLCALPVGRLAIDLADGTLAANPMPEVIRSTGLWSLRLMVIGLALSPLRELTGWAGAVALRRMLGLFAAFYAAMHLLAWARHYRFDWPFLLDETLTARYLTVGAIAALLLIPIAITSSNRLHAALGWRVWGGIHALIYPTVIAAYVHDLMARRFDRVEALATGSAIAALLAWRVEIGRAHV